MHYFLKYFLKRSIMGARYFTAENISIQRTRSKSVKTSLTSFILSSIIHIKYDCNLSMLHWWINQWRRCDKHTKEYFFYKMKFVLLSTMGMNLKFFFLSQISHKQENNVLWYLYMKWRKFNRTKSERRVIFQILLWKKQVYFNEKKEKDFQ